jgi:endonuclease YncB( thermonuclease family)
MIQTMKTLARLCLVIVVAAVLGAESFSGKVVGITDGDTIRVVRGGKAEPVRLHGVDCPETRQAFGTRARQFTSRLAFGKQVTVQVRDVDRYGRIVGEVLLSGGRSLNRELVTAGLAWWYRRYAPEDEELARLELEARDAKRGLWGERQPVPPWEFRRGRGRVSAGSTGRSRWKSAMRIRNGACWV